MKWLNDDKTTLMFAGMIAIALCGGRTKADFIFGEPVNLGLAINAPSCWQGEPSISADSLSLYFVSNRPGGSGDSDLWVATRPTTDDEWEQPVNLGLTVNSPAKDENPCISADGLELYFASNRTGSYGGHDIWVTRRPTKDDVWGEPINLGPMVNTDMMDISPCIAADGLSLYLTCYQRDRIGCYDLFVTKREATDSPWGEPVRLGPDVNYQYNDVTPSIAADGLTLFYTRGAEPLSACLWMTNRASTSELWSPTVCCFSMFDASSFDYAPSISADGSVLYFESRRTGGFGDSDIWLMSIEPILDFNKDGIVNAHDMSIMVAHWGEDYPLCDIGPTPLGDRIVDVQDLIVLAEHLFEECPPGGYVE